MWKKKPRRNETNEVEETNEIEEIAFTIMEETDSSETQKASHQHDWLADSATTSHITNQRSAFTTFQPLTNTSVRGVGDVTTKAKGCGTGIGMQWSNISRKTGGCAIHTDEPEQPNIARTMG